MNTLETIAGGVTAPEGFRAAGVACGIKSGDATLDLAIVHVDADIDGGGAVPAAGVFTTNLVTAAPVIVSREHLARSGGSARAVIINSGCANCCNVVKTRKTLLLTRAAHACHQTRQILYIRHCDSIIANCATQPIPKGCPDDGKIVWCLQVIRCMPFWILVIPRRSNRMPGP